MNRVNAYYGWNPDKPDFRDTYRIERPRTTPLPASVDLRAQFPVPCYDQGKLGSCTANAIAGAVEFDQVKQKLKTTFTPSRLFIYYNERVMEGTVGEDSGAEIRDGIKSLNTLGAPPERCWPYLESKFTRKPSKRAYTAGKAHPALRYERLSQNLPAMKAALSDGFPFVFGFTVYESFESDAVSQTGTLDMPGQNEQMLGGHAVLAMGYDDASKRFLVRNSWNTDWGMNGYFTIPYDYLTDRNLADDFWVIELVK